VLFPWRLAVLPVKIIVEVPPLIEPPLTLKLFPIVVVLLPNDKVELELGFEILLKLVFPATVWVTAVFAVNDTVLLFALNTPLFVQSPVTDKMLFPFIVNEAPPEILMLWHTAPAALMTGWFGVPGGMIASVVEVGITPLHQLDGVNQSLVFPSHALPEPQGWAIA
jgi:hypothetical protein